MDESARPIADLLAKDEIRDLALRYSSAIERRDVDAMADLFVEHARFGAAGSGPEGLRRLMGESMAGSVFAVILVANHLVEIDDPDRAHGEVWARCYSQDEADGWVEQLIRYVDRYERVDGRWRFLHRRHHLWVGVGSEMSPMTQDPASWPESQVGVGDLPLADPVFRRWWTAQRGVGDTDG